MRSDRYTKIVLTVIAIGLWALTMAQMGSPIGQAQAGVPAAEQEQSSHEFRSPPPGTFPTRTGTSTLPLRWRVRHALLHDGASVGGADCLTIVSVRNFGPATATVDVEWLDLNYDSVQLSSASLEAGRTRNFATFLSGDITNSAPFIADVWPAVANMRAFGPTRSDARFRSPRATSQQSPVIC